MARLTIGIQGSRGSVNEKGCLFFASKYHWGDIEIKYLISTDNVLKELTEGTIDRGTFAWESTRAGMVRETQRAVHNYSFTLLDEEWFCPEHALLMKTPIETTQPIHIFSHPQALLEHKSYIISRFPNARLIDEIDTAVAAYNLEHDAYEKNSLVIAPIECAQIYNLSVFEKNLPTNEGYLTKIVLVQR